MRPILQRTAFRRAGIYSKGYAYVLYGATFYGKGLFREAETYLLSGCDLGEKAGHTILVCIGKWMLGETYLATADYSKSSLFFDNAAEAGRFKFLPSVISLFGAGSALAGVMRNEKSLSSSRRRREARVFAPPRCGFGGFWAVRCIWPLARCVHRTMFYHSVTDGGLNWGSGLPPILTGRLGGSCPPCFGVRDLPGAGGHRGPPAVCLAKTDPACHKAKAFQTSYFV